MLKSKTCRDTVRRVCFSTRRRVAIFILLVLLIVPATAGAAKGRDGKDGPGITTPGKAAPVPLEVMIGQMLMVGFRGLAAGADHYIVREIRERHLGGVILFDYDVPSRSRPRNIESPSQLQALTAALQRAAARPLLISIDQEGGMISRLRQKDGFPPTPSHRFLGKLDDHRRTYGHSLAMAGTLARAGINLNLAPVVDLCINPLNPIIARYERCFSADPQTVVDHARQFIRAHRKQGILTAVKHFPGHGSSDHDSHIQLTDVTRTWIADELIPFRRLIDESLVDAVMTAHIFHAGLDKDWPATLSPATITGILREQMGFDGLVISDDMQMAAIADHFGLETAIEQAIHAGVDILLFANNSHYDENISRRATEIIRGLVSEGRIAESRIAESYRRIRALKDRLPTNKIAAPPREPNERRKNLP